MSTKAESGVLAKRNDGIDWTAVRDDFPILCETINGHPLIYVDNAASSQNRNRSSTPSGIITSMTTLMSTAASTN